MSPVVIAIIVVGCITLMAIVIYLVRSKKKKGRGNEQK